MKNLLLILLISSLFFFSCENDVVDYGLGKYYQEFATVLNDSAYLLDTGQTLYNVNYKKSKTLEMGKRVLLTYSYDKTGIFPYDYTIIVHGLSEIGLRELKVVAQKDLDALPTDPVCLESVWLGSHYLNMRFYINYNSKPHSIGIFSDSTQLNADTVRIYFIHDLNDDLPGYPAHLSLSFDLGKVLGPPENKKILSLNINTNNYSIKSYEFKY
jgi:hypothetical protein